MINGEYVGFGIWFNRHDSIKFDLSQNDRKYLVYGSNLCMFTHSDKAKEKLIPGLIRHEARQAYSQCRFVYAYLHHIHHKQRRIYTHCGPMEVERDIEGMTLLRSSPSDGVHVEYLRSSSVTDKWHLDHGDSMAPSSLECFIHDPEHGQVARFTHNV